MAEARARLTMKDVRASVQRLQREGEKLVGRLQRDARALVTRSQRDAVTGLVSDARKLRADLRKRAEKAMRELDQRRAQILASLEGQIAGLVELVVKRLNVPTEKEIAELRRRVNDLDRRLEAVEKTQEHAA
jgi:hypothetical protein